MWLARYGLSTLRATMILTILVAAVFGYLEQLLQQGDPAKISQEIARLTAFSTSFSAVGFESDVVEMFMESAMELLEKMRQALLRHDVDGAVLFQTMNNEEESNSILYYFKVCIKNKRNSATQEFLFRGQLTWSDPDKYLHAIPPRTISAFLGGNDRV
jgi:hypothetical protein